VQTYQAIEALSDPTRRAIFETLRHGPTSVVDVARQTPVSRPAVSQHLKVLKDAGLVRVHAEGTRRIYAIDPAGLAAVRDYFENFWDDTLAAYGEAVRNSAVDHPGNAATARDGGRKSSKENS
jgi:DNA-binding transcriptional ArsR family regulator